MSADAPFLLDLLDAPLRHQKAFAHKGVKLIADRLIEEQSDRRGARIDLVFRLRKRQWPQILAWMMAGCLEWRASGLRWPDAVAGATDRYFANQDGFGPWLDEQCE